MTARERTDAEIEADWSAYMARPNPRPETREEWLAQLAEWDGRANIESLLVWGQYKGWER